MAGSPGRARAQRDTRTRLGCDWFFRRDQTSRRRRRAARRARHRPRPAVARPRAQRVGARAHRAAAAAAEGRHDGGGGDGRQRGRPLRARERQRRDARDVDDRSGGLRPLSDGDLRHAEEMWLRSERGRLAVFAPERFGAAWNAVPVVETPFGQRQHEAWLTRHPRSGRAPRYRGRRVAGHADRRRGDALDAVRGAAVEDEA